MVSDAAVRLRRSAVSLYQELPGIRVPEQQGDTAILGWLPKGWSRPDPRQLRDERRPGGPRGRNRRTLRPDGVGGAEPGRHHPDDGDLGHAWAKWSEVIS